MGGHAGRHCAQFRHAVLALRHESAHTNQFGFFDCGGSCKLQPFDKDYGAAFHHRSLGQFRAHL